MIFHLFFLLRQGNECLIIAHSKMESRNPVIEKELKF